MDISQMPTTACTIPEYEKEYENLYSMIARRRALCEPQKINEPPVAKLQENTDLNQI